MAEMVKIAGVQMAEQQLKKLADQQKLSAIRYRLGRGIWVFLWDLQNP